MTSMCEHCGCTGATPSIAVHERLLAPDFLADLQRGGWPGNARELRNYIERCLTLHERTPIGGVGLPEADASVAAADLVDTATPLREAREKWTAILERRYLAAALQAQGGNVAAAARAAATFPPCA